jgi:hypothetical protein
LVIFLFRIPANCVLINNKKQIVTSLHRFFLPTTAQLINDTDILHNKDETNANRPDNDNNTIDNPSSQSYSSNQNENPSESIGTLHQTVITSKKDNNPFGNIMDNNKPEGTIRLYLKNINGIKSYNTWSNWNTACKELIHMGIDIFGVTETNLKWNTKNVMEARNILQYKDNFYSAQISTSSHHEPTLTNYQPGGTATTITNKWTGRIKRQIHDSSGMGRWSGFQLQTNTDIQLNILTVYRPTISQGIHTCYQQQMNSL